MTIALPAGRACGVSGAICTKGENRRKLTNTPSATVRGPVAVSVADARVREVPDATLDFAVTLSRASSGTVAVAYATADGSATAGSDYTARKGELTFDPGETEKTVSVPVLDDAHDEGAETMQLRLSAASGAAIADGVATGTIENTDHMPAAWLARFGAHGDGPGAGGGGGAAGGSAEAGGYAALWGLGAFTRFDGREGDLTLNGEVTTGPMGADWAAERWTGGLGCRPCPRHGRLPRGRLHAQEQRPWGRRLRGRGRGDADRSLALYRAEADRPALGLGGGQRTPEIERECSGVEESSEVHTGRLSS